jgi:hypothetical protein
MCGAHVASLYVILNYFSIFVKRRKRTMKRQERAIELRAQGMLYKDIGAKLGVSATMARKYVCGDRYTRPTAESRENAPYTCNKPRPGYQERCKRQAGHRGIHLVNDENGKLVYWE